MTSEFYSALAGAFFGALAAFGLEALRDWFKNRDEQYGAITRAQLAMVGQFNTMNGIRKQFLDAFRDHPQRESALQMFSFTKSALIVNYDSIAFLVNGNPNLIMGVHSAERTYISALKVLDDRNRACERLHQNSVLQTMDPTGRCTILPKDLRDVKLLKDLTDSLYSTVDNAQERTRLQFTVLRMEGKKRFPKRTFLDFEAASKATAA